MNGIEYTGSSQLAITPGGVSGELLGIDAVREFNVLTDTYSAEYGKRAGAQVNVVTQSGTNALHGRVFEFLRNSALDARNYFSQGDRSSLRAKPVRRRARRTYQERQVVFLFGNYEGFRQALTAEQRQLCSRSRRRAGFAAEFTRASSSGCRSQSCDAAIYVLLAASRRTASCLPTNGNPSGTSLARSTVPNNIFARISAPSAPITIWASGTVLSGAYTIDDGYSLVPLADPLFASCIHASHASASLQETHIFSPTCSTSPASGFLAPDTISNSSPLASFSPSLDFVTGDEPGRNCDWRRCFDHRRQSHHFGGSQQRRRSFQSQKSFHLCGRCEDQQGTIRSASGSGSRGCRTTKRLLRARSARRLSPA